MSHRKMTKISLNTVFLKKNKQVIINEHPVLSTAYVSDKYLLLITVIALILFPLISSIAVVVNRLHAKPCRNMIN